MDPLLADLAGAGAEVRETHISRVLLEADTVLKIKKPVELGFLDFRTLQQRRAACDAEVALNRRLAPDVYLGVVPITRGDDGVHRLGGDGPAVEWAVRMRRLADRDAASARLDEGRLSRADVVRVAEHVAEFHARAREDEATRAHGSPELIRQNVVENFEQTRDTAPAYLQRRELADIERWQLGFLERQSALLERRVAEGRVRDGHGDLRLEHVYIDDAGAIRIIDCIEFNDRFRYGDVCADVAFLAMDLVWHERTDLAEAFLAAYACAAGDYELYALVDFYQSYRAYVRGKVASFVAEGTPAGTPPHERAARDTRKYYLLAEAYQREPLAAPAVYAVGGIIASGKSTVAQQLSARLDAPVVDADRTRKQLAGVTPETPLRDAAFGGRYSEDATARVYAEVMRRASYVLESGRPVVLDASFRSRALRALARDLAARHGVAFRFVECRAPREVCLERLALRARGPSVSDGRTEILDSFMARYEPVDELSADELLVLDTTRPVDAALDALGPGRQPG